MCQLRMQLNGGKGEYAKKISYRLREFFILYIIIRTIAFLPRKVVRFKSLCDFCLVQTLCIVYEMSHPKIKSST